MKFLEKITSFAVSVTMCLTLCCNTLVYADSHISANNSIAYQCFKFSTYSSTNGYLFAFGNTQYKWDYTVNLFYN